LQKQNNAISRCGDKRQELALLARSWEYCYLRWLC